ncbi:MAG: hypothetical protein ACHQX0_02560, partial [Desulfobaccales bacterium]
MIWSYLQLWYSMRIKKTMRGVRGLGGKSRTARSEAQEALSEIFLSRIERAVRRAQTAMLGMQQPEGYWWAELESNVTITAEYLMLHRFLGLDE